jgi:Acyl-CoA dehydrogenase, C-terminal domain
MDLSLTSDQIAILDALDSLAKPYAEVSIGDHSCALVSAKLDRALAEGGFFDVAFDPDLGTVTAAIIVERLARLPFTTEAAMRALVQPALGEGITGPLCLVEAGKRQPLLRFLGEGATVVVVGDDVRSFTATAAQVRAEPEALFGYPVATLLEVSPTASHQISADEIRTRWRVALAAEAAGLLAAALNSVCAHVTQREQFGRPLGSFQAVRHRLAEAQVRTNGVYWLAMKAAATLGAGDAALAALHAQETIRACVYDFHQFMGAMGMTLEHPLHLWTYRLKLLSSEVGGRGANALAAAEAIWG